MQQPSTSTLVSRLYSLAVGKSLQIAIVTAHTHSPPCTLPLVESVFTDNQMKPKIHDCFVDFLIGTAHHKYRVFFKNHLYLPVNTALQRLSGQAFRGDFLVMMCNQDGTPSGMNIGDSKRADLMLQLYVQAPIPQFLSSRR